MSRIVTRNINAKIPKYTQGYFLCNFSRSFLVEKCQDASGTERSLKIQLTNQGETIEDFSDFHAGLGIFIADGFNIAWYRNPSPYDIDFSALISQDVLQSSNIFGNVRVENPLDYSQNINGDPVPLLVKVQNNDQPLVVTIDNQNVSTDFEEIILQNGDLKYCQDLTKCRIQLAVTPLSIASDGTITETQIATFSASLIPLKGSFVKDFFIGHNFDNSFTVGYAISAFTDNGYRAENTYVKAGERIRFLGHKVGGTWFPQFKGV